MSRLTPASARGEAMGLHNSSLTVGVALGGPLAGLAADTLSPPWGFVAVGGVGALIALLVLPTQLGPPRPDAAPVPTQCDRPPRSPPPPRPSAAQAGPAGAVPTAR